MGHSLMPNSGPPNSHLERKLPSSWRDKGSVEGEFDKPFPWCSASAPGLKLPPILHHRQPFWARPWNLWPAEAKQRMVNLHPWGQSKCLIAGGKPVCCWHSGQLPGPSIANNTHCCEADGWRGWRRYGEIWCSCGDWVRSLPPKRTTLKCHIERWCSAPSPGSKKLSMTEDGRRLQSRRWNRESRKRPRRILLPMIFCLFNTVKEWLAVSAQDGYWAVHR